MPHLEFSALTLLLCQIAVILVVSRGLGFVVRWLRQPLVIAEIVAGILLGPSLLGWLWPEAMARLFPVESLSTLELLSQVGLVLFMFLVGLELDPQLLKDRTKASVAISHTSIVVPFALGAGLSWWLHDSYAPPHVPLLPFLSFFGVALSVTAFPVLARILSERHLLASRVGAVAIACAAVGDVVAWCGLAFVAALARAQSTTQAVWTAGFAVVFIVALLFLARPFLGRLASRVANREGLTPAVVAVTLLCLLFSAMLTELIGIHALFGAFLFGAILPKQGRLAETLADKLETVSVVLLLPLFFAYSGLRTEIGLISQPREWLVTGAIVVFATLGKFGGSTLAARLTGVGWREASAVGILMNTRGLVGLVVLNLGLDLGVISPTVFTMLVLMALVTTFITSPVLAWVYPDQALGREREDEPAEPAGAGVRPFGVMICVSDATAGPGLATLVGALASGKRDQPSSVLALHLWDPTHRPLAEQRRREADVHQAPLVPLLAQAKELGVEVRALAFASGAPARDICRTAQAKGMSLMLLGAHKPLLLSGRLSGVVSEVVAKAHCPVAVLVDRGLNRVARVLVAYAGGPEDVAALELARRIGGTSGTTLTLFHVIPPGDHQRRGKGREQIAHALQDLSAQARQVASQADAEVVEHVLPEPDAAAGSVHVRLVEHASPPDAVLEECQRGYDLVVIGMHARWGLGVGTISWRRQRVLAEAPVSILAVHPPLGASAPEGAGESHPSRLANSTA